MLLRFHTYLGHLLLCRAGAVVSRLGNDEAEVGSNEGETMLTVRGLYKRYEGLDWRRGCVHITTN